MGVVVDSVGLKGYMPSRKRACQLPIRRKKVPWQMAATSHLRAEGEYDLPMFHGRWLRRVGQTGMRALVTLLWSTISILQARLLKVRMRCLPDHVIRGLKQLQLNLPGH